MRESIGGAWLFGVVIVFIFFFSAFLAYSVSYTRAFNVKNEIINLVEQNEGYTTFSGFDIASATDTQLNNSTEGKIYLMIKNVGYNYSTAKNIKCENGQLASSGGYCIAKYCTNPGDPISNVHYKITTYIALELPILNVMIKIPISGETRTLYTDHGSLPCS